MGSSASSVARKKPVADRVERDYRLYRIVAGDLGGLCKAVAYLRMGGSRPVESVEAASVDEALSMMEEVLAARLAAMRQERRDGVPTAAEFLDSLAALPASTREGIRSLQIERLDTRAPSPALAILSLRTQTDPATIADDLRKAARKLGELLEAKPGKAAPGSDPLNLLAKVEGPDADGVLALIFHDEFCKALAALPPERATTMVGRR